MQRRIKLNGILLDVVEMLAILNEKVRIPVEFVTFSYAQIILGKGMNPTLIHLALGWILGTVSENHEKIVNTKTQKQKNYSLQSKIMFLL